MTLGRSLIFLLGTTTALVAASANANADTNQGATTTTTTTTRMLSNFHHDAKKSIETHARRVLKKTKTEAERRRLMFGDGTTDGELTWCGILQPMFDYALENEAPEGAPEGTCTCDDTTDPEALTIACAFQDVCDPTQEFNGMPMCASEVTVSYTLGGLGSFEDMFATLAPGEEFKLTMTATATVDMSNPDLEVYSITFDLDFTEALDDVTTPENEGAVTLLGSCSATYAGEDCECTLELENLVDEDLTNDEDYCFMVDCTMVNPDWPPMKEGECNSMESNGGAALETTSFLLAFDDTAPAVTDDGDAVDDSTGDGDGDESDASNTFSMTVIGGSLAAAAVFAMV